MPPAQRPQKPVRQPKQGRARATVATLLEAGARILAEGGWPAFNTNAVAARAGVSIGSVYEYFPNKQALVDAIAEAHLARGEALLAGASALEGQALELATLAGLLVQGVVALHEDDPRLHRVLSSEVPLSAAVRDRAARLRLGFIGFVARSLHGRVTQPRLSAQLIVDATDAAVHRWWVEDDGRLAQPQILAGELARMLGAYLESAALDVRKPGTAR